LAFSSAYDNPLVANGDTIRRCCDGSKERDEGLPRRNVETLGIGKIGSQGRGILGDYVGVFD